MGQVPGSGKAGWQCSPGWRRTHCLPSLPSPPAACQGLAQGLLPLERPPWRVQQQQQQRARRCACAACAPRSRGPPSSWGPCRRSLGAHSGDLIHLSGLQVVHAAHNLQLALPHQALQHGRHLQQGGQRGQRRRGQSGAWHRAGRRLRLSAPLGHAPLACHAGLGCVVLHLGSPEPRLTLTPRAALCAAPTLSCSIWCLTLAAMAASMLLAALAAGEMLQSAGGRAVAGGMF